MILWERSDYERMETIGLLPADQCPGLGTIPARHDGRNAPEFQRGEQLLAIKSTINERVLNAETGTLKLPHRIREKR